MMHSLWSLKHASGFGTVAGLLALLLWPFVGMFDPLMLWLFILIAGLASLCGFLILAMTVHDISHRPRRGSRIRALRGFDTSLATVLLVLSWFELHDAIGLFPA